MKQCYILFLFLLLGTSSFAQSAADYAVQVTATVQQSPAQIQLHWKRVTFTNPTYYVFRKAQNATSWGSSIATLPTTDSVYTDVNVVAGNTYEYQVFALGSFASYGYVFAGINVPPIHNRGVLLLLVDSMFTDSCKNELNTLMNDISGDGWQIVRHDIARTTNDTTIFNTIAKDYATYSNVNAALILGHIAVPYSGDLNPDGHAAHLGAWPADVYYATLGGPWTDNTVFDTSAGFAANKNIPGDGKWDQTLIPSAVQLQISRIDFYNMPVFTKTEVQLMKSYLNKDHQYKMDSLNIIHRALINDNFGAFNGEAFAANGWRNFPPLVGAGNVTALPFIATLNDSSYQWAYGCGGGSFSSASGVGSTTDFTTNNINAIFTMTFGSYFGDWNTPNNFLRAPLCSNVPALTNCWAGRPNWFVHHMALGQNIGYSTMLTQNNSTLYSPPNYAANAIHIALMGDLTLRTDYVKPPANLVIASVAGGSAVITWQPSPDAGVSGYYIYRADSLFGNYQLLNTVAVSSMFTDSFGISGLKYYMVRPAKLTQTPSGSYYNLGIGIKDTATVKLFYHTGVPTIAAPMVVQLYPNPVKDHLNLVINATAASKATIKISNIAGQTLLTSNTQFINGKNTFGFDVQKFAPGTYIISIHAGDEVKSLKWVKTD
ncbi:MAG: T9SS type A sorting domain-containing protein [Flavipsychrobacter sp.]|nr:T9SS type A sorting domain-containing protein [Flavipsychrobacter sp.]